MSALVVGKSKDEETLKYLSRNWDTRLVVEGEGVCRTARKCLTVSAGSALQITAERISCGASENVRKHAGDAAIRS
jgi:hypothetical protein